MQSIQRSRVTAFALLLALCAAFLPPGLGGALPVQAAGAINLTALNTAYSENFDSLASSCLGNRSLARTGLAGAMLTYPSWSLTATLSAPFGDVTHNWPSIMFMSARWTPNTGIRAAKSGK